MINAVSKHVLVVDDSPLQAIMLRRILVQAGFQVVTAKSGVEALESLRNDGIAIIISDINMPNMDGFEFCKQVKKDPKFSKIPVILCTALTDPDDLIRGIEVGADKYITRPYNSENLLSLVYELLNTVAVPLNLAEFEDVIIEGHHYHIGTTR